MGRSAREMSRPQSAGMSRPQSAGMSRPQSASSYRTSASFIGAHAAQKNKFANTKSKFRQRPSSAPVGGRKANSKSKTDTASRIFRHNGESYAVKHQHKLTGYKLSQQLGEDVKGKMRCRSRGFN